jgi:hypothetical protein
MSAYLLTAAEEQPFPNRGFGPCVATSFDHFSCLYKRRVRYRDTKSLALLGRPVAAFLGGAEWRGISEPAKAQ